MSGGNVFVFSFSNEGFEAIVNLTEIDQRNIMEKMAGEKTTETVSSILSMMQLRARYNEARRMEVWLLKLSEEFTAEDLESWAEEDPQAVADFARQGEPLYPDRRILNKKPVIT